MAGIDQQLAALELMPTAQLRTEWLRLYKTALPNLPADIIRRVIGYRLQEMALHGGAGHVHRALQRMAIGKTAVAPRLRVGTQLIRSWNGRSITVIVKEGSFAFEGRSYGSLSAIANEVTGTKWSGPRFFGLIKGADCG